MIGQTLAHYRITEAIGAGEMGEVCRATDSKLGAAKGGARVAVTDDPAIEGGMPVVPES